MILGVILLHFNVIAFNLIACFNVKHEVMLKL